MSFSDGEEELNDESLETAYEKDILEKYVFPLENESDFRDSEMEENDINHKEADFISKYGSIKCAKSIDWEIVIRWAQNEITSITDAGKDKKLYMIIGTIFTKEILEIIVNNTDKFINSIKEIFGHDREPAVTDIIEI